MPNNCVVVFCANNEEVTKAKKFWVTDHQYQLAHRSDADLDASHQFPVGATYDRCAKTPLAKYTIVLVFEGD